MILAQTEKLRAARSFPTRYPLSVDHVISANGKPYQLRGANDSDIGWLFELYAESRFDEMSVVRWINQAKTDFLTSQFLLQHEHFVTHFPDAQFLIITADGGERIGRYYLNAHASSPFHIIDICLRESARGHGIGGALIAQTIALAAARGTQVRLHVLNHNLAAQRLYQRLGFRRTADAAASHTLHLEMICDPAQRGEVS